MSEISICIATYGSSEWDALARERAYPSACEQGAREVVLHHQPEGDVASSRNTAAEQATGEWLCFLDGDDELSPYFIHRMERAIRNVGGRYSLLTPRISYVVKGRTKPPRFWPGDQKTFRTGNWLVIGTLVQRELFMEVGGFRPFPHGLEDYHFWAKCVQAGAEIHKVPAAIYIAHFNTDSKHHQLARNRAEYMKEYERVRKDLGYA